MYLENQYQNTEDKLQQDVQTFYNELETFSNNPTEIFSYSPNPFLGYITNLRYDTNSLTFDLGVNKSFVVRHFNNVVYTQPQTIFPDHNLHSKIYVYIIQNNKERKLDLEYVLIRTSLYEKDFSTGEYKVVKTQKEPFEFFDDIRMLSL